MSKILIAVYVITTSLGLILLKLGADSGPAIGVSGGRPNFNLNTLAVSGILLYGMSFVLYTYLLSKYDLGYIIPLTTALVYITIFTASYFVFKEAFTALKISGIALIILGLVLLNIKK